MRDGRPTLNRSALSGAPRCRRGVAHRISRMPPSEYSVRAGPLPTGPPAWAATARPHPPSCRRPRRYQNHDTLPSEAQPPGSVSLPSQRPRQRGANVGELRSMRAACDASDSPGRVRRPARRRNASAAARSWPRWLQRSSACSRRVSSRPARGSPPSAGASTRRARPGKEVVHAGWRRRVASYLVGEGEGPAAGESAQTAEETLLRPLIRSPT